MKVLYDYKCDACEVYHEARAESGDKNDRECPNCGEAAKWIPCAPNVEFLSWNGNLKDALKKRADWSAKNGHKKQKFY